MKWSLFLGSIVALLAATLALPSLLRRTEEDGQTANDIQGPLEEVVLDKAKQEHIWTLEHITFEIETHFGKPFVKGLSGRDPEKLTRYFSDSFVGEKPTDGPLETRRAGPVTASRRRVTNTSIERVDAGQLAEHLTNALSDFEMIERARLRVLKIDKVADAEHTWRTELLITAHGTGQEGQILFWDSEHEVTFRYDEKQQLIEGSTIASWKWTRESTRRSDQALMQEVTAEVGLDRLGLTDNWQLPTEQQIARGFQMAVEDFDRDGFLDIAIAATASNRPYLLHSVAGRRFEDQAGSLGLRGWNSESSLVGWIDYDNDGYPDLLMGDRLYRNVEGQRFADVTQISGLSFDFEPTGCTVVDYDADGRLDLYVLYEIPRSRITQSQGDKPSPWVGDEQSGSFNRLWHNEGGGRFRDVTFQASATGGKRQTFAASWLFYDEDHLPDVYIANDFGENVLLRNQGDGTFANQTKAAGCGDFATSMGVTSGDLDNDGQTEIYVANMYSKMGRRILANVGATDYPQGMYEQLLGSCAGNRLYTRSEDEGRFRETSEALGINGVGWAFAPAMADFDGYGWLDVYATTGFRSYERGKPDG